VPVDLLILTNSVDGTADCLVGLCRECGHSVFRFNVDLYDSYQLAWTENSLLLADANGRVIRVDEVGACLWRKPFVDGLRIQEEVAESDLSWIQSQLKHLLREIARYCRERGRLDLVDPWAEMRFGKLHQLITARKYLSTPMFHVGWGITRASGEVVVKGLSSDLLGGDRVFYSTRTRADQLDPRFPWFTQEAIVGDRDVTVVFIDGDLFAYERDEERSADLIDWRVTINSDSEKQWYRVAIDEATGRGIRSLMTDLNLRYGRLDFIRRGSELVFLEVNPNGQFGWLDDDSLYLHRRFLAAVLNDELRGNS
jgi:hypothetical protein